jgi:epoxyqueuosine reductase
VLTQTGGVASDVDQQLAKLRDSSEQVRMDAVMQLGRMRADRAIDPIAATLAADPSPSVREAAARALGLIGSQKAMPALQRAAQADSSAQVRGSAQYAIDVVNAR